MLKKSYDDTIHFYGRLWMIAALIIMFGVPTIIALYFRTWPDLKSLAIGVGSLSLMNLPGGIIEVITYSPMLGTGGTYLAFVTGNLSNLKIPCAMNANDITGTKFGTKENEVISTLSVGASTIVTTLVIVIGVVCMVPLTPILQAPVLQPAFDNVVPALFGALGAKYFLQSPKLAVAPLTFMILLCFLVPSVSSQISILIFAAAAVSIVVGRILYQKGKV